MKKILFSVLITAVSLLFLNGCFFADKPLDFQSDAYVKVGEAFLPQDILFLIKFSTLQDLEYQNLSHIKEMFSTIKKNSLTEILDKELSFYNLNYKQDIHPMIGQQSETVVAVGGKLNSGAFDLYLIQKINDFSKYTILVDKLLQNQKITAIAEGYETLTPSQQKLVFAQRGDYLVVTNNKENLAKIINLDVSDSLVYTKNYQTIRENLPLDFLGIVYIDMEKVVQQVKSVFQNISSSGSIAMMNMDGLDIWTAVGGVLNAKQDGFKFSGFVQGNKEELSKMEWNFNDIPNQNTYLEKILPGDNLYFYLEKFNLKYFFEKLENNLEKNNEVAYQQFLDSKIRFKELIGLDFDQNILSWFDKSMAISIQGVDSVLPAITIAVDASSNPNDASKLLNIFDSLISIAKLSHQKYAEAI